MGTKITTKFIVGSEQGINALLYLGANITREKFAGKVTKQELDAYIDTNFNQGSIIIELNSFSNEYVIVYADGEPAGYGRVTTKGVRPELFKDKTLARIADFGVLARYDNSLIQKSLFEKCLSTTRMPQVIWISTCENDPYLAFFESYGFQQDIRITAPQEWSLPPVYLVKEKLEFQADLPQR